MPVIKNTPSGISYAFFVAGVVITVAEKIERVARKRAIKRKTREKLNIILDN